jgi:hypothetical protein
MDDVDAVQAQIAHNMLQSGDWVTARLDGIKYLEKSPLKYWMIAVCFEIFGVHDWAARIPIALSAILLCWLVARMAGWSMGARAGLYAGLSLATSVGLWLFTRVLIPDVVLTLSIACAMWCFFRALEVENRWWALGAWASIGIGILLKGLIAGLFPIGTALLYLLVSGLWREGQTWRRLSILPGLAVMLAIAAPWHVLATLRNPPYFDFTMHSERGSYRGFFWFYFINEQLLRFLNLRYPRDYNTVPRLYFWLFHLIWLFPWSVYLPGIFRLSYRPVDRAGRTRLLAACWILVVLVFFTFSTTQEYYSMPCYPALALLLGSAMAAGGKWIERGTRILCVISGLAAAAAITIVVLVRNIPTPGDISSALSSNPAAYTLSLGHMLDLTLPSFAYLRIPLMIAALAFLVGFAGMLRRRSGLAFLSAAVMMVIFFQGARAALVVFDPYMSSRPLAEALRASPPGRLIVDHHYYTYSSIFFYTDRTASLLNGRIQNLVYGSYAPGAPDVFIDDAQFREIWLRRERCYLVADDPRLPQIERLVAPATVRVVRRSGGKLLLVNATD